MRLIASRALGFAIALLAITAGPGAIAQTGTIAGQVIDADNGEPLTTAAVTIVGRAGIGAAADIDGSYSFEVAPGTYTLQATFIGYVTQTAQVTVTSGGTTTQNFGLEADLTGLEEVVVTGALSERSLSQSEVAVSRINAAELTDVQQYSDVNQLLNGKVAGVSVQPSSGNVGGGIRFNVRGGGGLNGNGQPLIYVDGIRVNNDQFDGLGAGGQGIGALSGLAPDDIATIDVLKGPAAAALYGTDASNGVVIITTKRGTIGGGANSPLPFQINYSGSTGQNTQQFEYDELTAGETFESANAGFVDGGIEQHTIGISGGSSAVRYFTQFDYRDEDGILPGNFQNRRNLRANFEAFPLSNLQLSATSSYNFNSVGQPQNDNNILGYLGNTLLFPFTYAFTDSLAVRAIESEYITNQFLGSFEARYTPIQNLQLRAQAGLDANDTRGDQFFPSNFVFSGVTNGERTVYTRATDQVSFLVDARYRYVPVEGLNASTSVGVQGFDRRLRTFSTRIQDFATELIPNAGAGSEFQAAGEFFNNLRQIGLIVEQSLDYNNTFFGTVGFRNDYASTIGVDAPSVIYPLARAAVRLDQFDAVPDLFSILKVRAAYGASGQLPNSFDPIAILYAAEVGGDGAGAVPSQIGNTGIEPERVTEFETGIDLEIANRVGIEFTYYNQRAEDSIFGRQLAPSTGLVASNVPFNVGEISLQGLELAINATAVQTRNFGLDLGIIASYQTNEVESVGFDGAGNPLPNLFDGFDVNVIAPGLARSTFYVTPVNGALFNDDGTYAGVDTGVQVDDNGMPLDSACNVEDNRCVRGIPYPEFNGSFTANLTLFQDFTVYALADWATGLSVFNNTDAFRAQFGNYAQRNDLADQLDTLTPGTQEYIDAANAFARTTGTLDDNFIREADYLKLRELTVRYNLGRLIAQAPGLNRVRTAALAFSARNLFQTSLYDGLDPEVNFNGARSLSRGSDFLTLQNPRQFFLTLTLGI
ncbi:TonB-dependent receptor plug domain-containing protein [Rubrivirga sp.]|uniref:TonB-dependent receptor plug domain-containing protein n=1 Tax=Rubrivirga sp. TaxID=1885344 RepID=UPI003C766AFA